MQIMPIAFSVMFLFFPSGLVLYWLVNNSLQIFQQWHMNQRAGEGSRDRGEAALSATSRGSAIERVALQSSDGLDRRAADTIAAIATPPGAAASASFAFPVARSRGDRSGIVGARARAAASRRSRHFAARAARRSTRASRSTSPRRTRTPASPCSSCTVTAARRCCGSLLARCVELGARLAEPGEFTQRAFLNGKLDLAQAESVADLIDAATATAARAAARSLSGAFSREVHALTDALIELRMFTEATLDFPDEDIDFLRAADARGKLDAICGAARATFSRARSRARCCARGSPSC